MMILLKLSAVYNHQEIVINYLMILYLIKSRRFYSSREIIYFLIFFYIIGKKSQY